MKLAHIRSAAFAALFLFVPIVAEAATISPADDALLAGEWATACGMKADGSRLRMVIEFAATGGQVSLDDGTEGAGQYPIKSATVTKDRVALSFGEMGGFTFLRKGDVLQGTSGDVANLSFTRCRPAADRSAIKLDRQALHYLSAQMPPDYAYFVDARVKDGCKATDYQYLTIDLVGPLGFTLGRWNSWNLAEKVAAGAKQPFDEVTNFTIDKAERMGTNYRLTVTELIPPNGSRGDTTTITLAPTPTGVLNVLEWKRSYRRCFASEKTAD